MTTRKAASTAKRTAATKVEPANYTARTGYKPGEIAPADLYVVDGVLVERIEPGQVGTVVAVKGLPVAPHIAERIARLSK